MLRHGVEQRDSIPVIDFRRHSMVLEWHALGGTWTAYDTPPPLVHGVALIRPRIPTSACWARRPIAPANWSEPVRTGGKLAPHHCAAAAWRVSDLRRRFTVESSTGGVLYSYAYWTSKATISFAGSPRGRQTPTGALRADGSGRRASRFGGAASISGLSAAARQVPAA